MKSIMAEFGEIQEKTNHLQKLLNEYEGVPEKMELTFKVGDKVLDKLQGVTAEIVFILENSVRDAKIVIRHIGDKSDYLAVKSADGLVKICSCCDCHN